MGHKLLRLMLAVTSIATPVAFDQAPSVPRWETAAGGRLEFEAASVRPSGPDSWASSNLDLDASDYFRYTGGLVTANGSLTNYILFAYKIEDASEYPRIQAQLPKWAQERQFYLEARPDGSPTKDQLRLMVRSLLGERFRFTLHTETRQLPAYVLTLEKPGIPGPGLQAHPEDGLCTKPFEAAASGSPASGPPASSPPASKPPGSKPPMCELVLWPEKNGLTQMRIMAHTIAQIAGELTTVGVPMGGMDMLPVLDETGLTGGFDLTVDFLRESRKPRPPDADSEPGPTGPAFMEALRKQAGLKLTKQTGPITTFVIDRVEPLSEN